MTTDELKQLAARARRAHHTLEDEQDKKINDLVAAFKQETTERVRAEYKTQLDDLRSKADAAKSAADEAVERDGLAGVNSPFPIGTKMVEWKPRYSRASYIPPGTYNPFLKTGKTGVVEAITRESRHSATMKHDRASLGETVIRLHNIDGRLGAIYVTKYRWYTWYPEGVDPNVKKEDKTA